MLEVEGLIGIERAAEAIIISKSNQRRHEAGEMGERDKLPSLGQICYPQVIVIP